MIVYCGKGEKVNNSNDFICEFETSYFTDKDTINIYEDSTYSQYLFYGENDTYKINLLNKDFDLIYLDMMIFSGDADLILPTYQNISHKYYLSNKIFYSIHLNTNNKPDFLEFIVNAIDKTFYMVNYQLIKNGVSEEKNIIESGYNYITSKYIDSNSVLEGNKKIIDLKNFEHGYQTPYLATFYSPNCKFSVQEKMNVSTVDNYYAQVIFEPKINPKDDNETYSFSYTILADNNLQYSKTFCMVYVAGIELLESDLEWNSRSISLSEGVPHRHTFMENYRFISYAYHISDITNTLVINFNLIDKTLFSATISIRGKTISLFEIYRNTQLYLDKDNYFDNYCEPFEVCTVNVLIKMINSEKEKTVEVTMYQIDKTPFYLEKNVIKDDILNGNYPKHYYFDINDKEYGDITLDFKRGSGFIFASIQDSHLNNPMNNPDWRGIYHFPTTIEESLKFDIYNKKIIINPENTTQCENGCFVLITIVSNVRYYGIYDDPKTPFRISIIPRVIQKDSEISIVKINVNEFIIGDIVSASSGKSRYDYYTVTLPFESEYIIFDWQADNPYLLINVGNERPLKNLAHISYPPIAKDFVYKINKSDIIKKGNITTNTLEGVQLTIGISSDINDSIESSPYAFKIFMPLDTTPKYIGEIIHIRSDQKV